MPIYTLDDISPELGAEIWIADTAILIGDIRLHSHASIWWHTVLRGDNDQIIVGARSNIQDGSVLHTDVGAPLTIGDEVTVGHMAMLHGCSIGNGSLIGIKSTILNHAVIGESCLIGANTLITEGKIIPDRSLVMGSPGKVIRELTDHEVMQLRLSAAHYVANAQRYREKLREIRPAA